MFETVSFSELIIEDFTNILFHITSSILNNNLLIKPFNVLLIENLALKKVFDFRIVEMFSKNRKLLSKIAV